MKTRIIKPAKDQTPEIVRCTGWFVLLICPLPLIPIMTGDNRFVFHMALLFTGWCCWTFTEYCIHRFKDHGESYMAGEGHESMHHLHHKHPTEIAISPLHRAGLLILCGVLMLLALWFDDYFTLIPGFVMGFTGYTFMHWFLHHKLSARLFPELHRFHIHHHCKHPDKCFGITITWWDHLFGTVPKVNTEITERIRSFYYKREKEVKRVISLNNIMDEKIQLNEKQST